MLLPFTDGVKFSTQAAPQENRSMPKKKPAVDYFL
jgi:hypothetical protein